jgi:hypothetical protein
VWWKAVAVLDAEFFAGCLNARCWLRAHGRSVNRGLRESSGMTPDEAGTYRPTRQF